MIIRSILALALLGWPAQAQVAQTLAGNPTPSVGCNAPTSILSGSDVSGNNSGVASSTKTTTDVPANSAVVVAINFSGASNQSFQQLTDSANNTYTIKQAFCSTCAAAALAYNLNVAHIPVNSTFTATTTSGGNGIWLLKGAWISCANGSLDQFQSITQTTASTTWTLTTGTLSNTNETAYAYAYPQSGGTVTTGSGFTDLLNNSFNDIAFKVQLGSSSAISYAPSWTSSVTSVGVLLTFLNSPIVTATWDPANTNTANLSLSSGNLTINALSSGTNWGTSRGTAGHTSGKYYWECTSTSLGTSATIGVVNSTFSTSTSTFAGQDTNSIGLQTATGKTFKNNVGTANSVTTANADVVEVAADLTNGNIWWRTNNNANWNNSSTANPATNTGGIAIGATGTLYPAASIFGGTTSAQWSSCSFGPTYTGTAPSGFGNW